MRVTVITPTWNRPALLAHTLEAFHRQRVDDAEHIVCSDGPDRRARSLAAAWSAKYLELPATVGNYGHACRDEALQHASGQYVVMWDDDNVYHDDCLETLLNAAEGHDVGVCQIRFWERSEYRFRMLPDQWDGRPKYAQVDTACVCIHRDLLTESGVRWTMPEHPYDADFFVLDALRKAGARFNFIRKEVGIHV